MVNTEFNLLFIALIIFLIDLETITGTSVFSSSETGMSGNFWGRIKGSK